MPDIKGKMKGKEREFTKIGIGLHEFPDTPTPEEIEEFLSHMPFGEERKKAIRKKMEIIREKLTKDKP